MRKPFKFDVDITPEGTPLEPSVRNLEHAMIVDAMQKTRGVKAKAAALLGMKRTSLIMKMKRLGMSIKTRKVVT